MNIETNEGCWCLALERGPEKGMSLPPERQMLSDILAVLGNTYSMNRFSSSSAANSWSSFHIRWVVLRKRRNRSAQWVLKHRSSQTLAGAVTCASPVWRFWRRDGFFLIEIVRLSGFGKGMFVLGEAFIELCCLHVKCCKCCLTDPSNANFPKEGEKALRVIVWVLQDRWKSILFNSCIHSGFL